MFQTPPGYAYQIWGMAIGMAMESRGKTKQAGGGNNRGFEVGE